MVFIGDGWRDGYPYRPLAWTNLTGF